MSFLTELEAILPKKLRGMDVAFYSDWASFYAACPLSREMITWHNPDGSERVAPERDATYYDKLFMEGDCFGLVLSKAGVPQTGTIYRRLSPDTAEQVIRIGKGAGYTGLRAWLHDLGIRKIVYKILKTDTHTHDYMQGMEVMTGASRTTTDKGDRYLYHEVTLSQRPKETQP